MRPTTKACGAALLGFLLLSGCGGSNTFNPDLRGGGGHQNGTGLADTAWPKFGFDAANGGVGKTITTTTFFRNFATQLGGTSFESPVIGGDGTVFVSSDNGRVSAVDGTSGAIKWTATVAGDSAALGAALGKSGLLYVPGNFLTALDPATGAVVWEDDEAYFPSTGATVGPDGTVYFGKGRVVLGGTSARGRGTTVGAIFAADGLTGHTKWQFSCGRPIAGPPALGPNGAIYFVGQDGAVIYAVDTATGHEIWHVLTPSRNTPTVGPDGTVYIVTEEGSHPVTALNGATGAVKWQTVTGMPFHGIAPAVFNGKVIISGEGTVMCLDAATGSKTWETSLDTQTFHVSPTISADGRVFQGTDSGKLYILNAATGAIVQTISETTSINTPTALSPESVYYVTSDAHLVCLSDTD